VLALLGVFGDYADAAAPNASFGSFDAGAAALKALALISTHTFLFLGLGLHAARGSGGLGMGFGALAQTSHGFALLFGACAAQWALLVNGFWRCVASGEWANIKVGFDELLRADMTAFSISIALACCIGALSISQVSAFLPSKRAHTYTRTHTRRICRCLLRW
jgi:hypothetical protein